MNVCLSVCREDFRHLSERDGREMEDKQRGRGEVYRRIIENDRGEGERRRIEEKERGEG
jgi:hypothetical protein